MTLYISRHANFDLEFYSKPDDHRIQALLRSEPVFTGLDGCTFHSDVEGLEFHNNEQKKYGTSI